MENLITMIGEGFLAGSLAIVIYVITIYLREEFEAFKSFSEWLVLILIAYFVSGSYMVAFISSITSIIMIILIALIYKYKKKRDERNTK